MELARLAKQRQRERDVQSYKQNDIEKILGKFGKK